jgi:hypothetical protein
MRALREMCGNSVLVKEAGHWDLEGYSLGVECVVHAMATRAVDGMLVARAKRWEGTGLVIPNLV